MRPMQLFDSGLTRLIAGLLLALTIPPTLVAEHAVPMPLAEGRDAAPWLGPDLLDPAAAGVGKTLADQTLQLIGGGRRNLYSIAGKAGTVIVVRDPECPVSRRYGPRIARMAKYYALAGLSFVFIYVNEELTPAQRIQDAEAMNVPGLYIGKGSFALADALGVESTGDVFVLDAQHHLRFRGAVDDQYGLGYTKDIATRHFLRDALESVLEGKSVKVPATSAPGCLIDADPEKDRLFEPVGEGQMLS